MKLSLILPALFLPFLLMAYELPEGDPDKPYYQNTVAGLPIGSGKRLGGVYTQVKAPTAEKEIIKIGKEGQKSANWWQFLFKITSSASIVFVFLWYFSSKRELGGAAILSLGCSLGCSIMAEIVVNVWILAALLLLTGAIIVIGMILKDKSLRRWWLDRRRNAKAEKESKAKAKPEPEAETEEGPKG